MSEGARDLPEASVPPTLFCIGPDGPTTEELRASVAALAPFAVVDGAEPEMLKDSPTADLVLLWVGPMARSAATLVRDLRARGYVSAILVVADDPTLLPTPGLDLLGVQRSIATAEVPTRLPAVLADVLDTQERVQGSASGQQLLATLRRLQGLLAAGQVASQLQHRLNNPLAALLAEAQLLELESLSAEHAVSVRRIIELCRRLIAETRALEGITTATPAPRG